MTFRSFGAPAIILMAAILSACASTAPTPIPAALHVENRLSEPIVIGISARGSGESVNRLVEACGGATDFVPGQGELPDHDWLIGIAGDPSGNLRANFEAAGGDPAKMVGLLIMWSTGEISPPQLPRWLTVEPTGVVETGSAPDLAPASDCLPWAFAPDG